MQLRRVFGRMTYDPDEFEYFTQSRIKNYQERGLLTIPAPSIIVPPARNDEWGDIDKGLLFYKQTSITEFCMVPLYYGVRVFCYLNREFERTFFVTTDGQIITGFDNDKKMMFIRSLHDKMQWDNVDTIVIEGMLYPFHAVSNVYMMDQRWFQYFKPMTGRRMVLFQDPETFECKTVTHNRIVSKNIMLRIDALLKEGNIKKANNVYGYRVVNQVRAMTQRPVRHMWNDKPLAPIINNTYFGKTDESICPQIRFMPYFRILVRFVNGAVMHNTDLMNDPLTSDITVLKNHSGEQIDRMFLDKQKSGLPSQEYVAGYYIVPRFNKLANTHIYGMYKLHDEYYEFLFYDKDTYKRGFNQNLYRTASQMNASYNSILRKSFTMPNNDYYSQLYVNLSSISFLNNDPRFWI
jgi:hypothetical protein